MVPVEKLVGGRPTFRSFAKGRRLADLEKLVGTETLNNFYHTYGATSCLSLFLTNTVRRQVSLSCTGMVRVGFKMSRRPAGIKLASRKGSSVTFLILPFLRCPASSGDARQNRAVDKASRNTLTPKQSPPRPVTRVLSVTCFRARLKKWTAADGNEQRPEPRANCTGA